MPRTVRAHMKQQMPDGPLEFFHRNIIARFVRDQHADPATAAKVVDQIVMPEFSAHVQELEDRLEANWTSRFSPAELQQIVANRLPPARRISKETFMATPLGQNSSARSR